MLRITQYRFTASSHLTLACPGATWIPAAFSNLAMSESSRVKVSVASMSRAASSEERVMLPLEEERHGEFFRLGMLSGWKGDER
jgi:hypothetical protein